MPPLLDAVGVSMERADPNKSLRERIMAIPDFPRAGVLFRDVKGFLSGPGVPLPPIDDAITTIVTCESGGVVFAEKLAAFWGLGPPVVIRKVRAEDADGGMVTFGGSFVSGVRTTFALEPFIVLPSRGVLFVDDVLSSGETALAVGRLLRRAGVGGTKAWFVAEFLGHQRDPALNELFAEMTSMVKFEGT
ncbi:phosphoribosyltransferase-like protein [Baffinella frigidus]|nr:phosphoribosyltransferase-like protein [Cryptophyta sp. CCMP2293]